MRFREPTTSTPKRHRARILFWLGKPLQKQNNLALLFESQIVTGESYKNMLRYYVFPVVLNYPGVMICQQYGAPSFSAVIVRQYSDQKLPDHSMARACPTS